MPALQLLVLCAVSAQPQFDGEVLDFSATWCGPCQRMNPVVHRLEREGLPIRQVDVDRNKQLAQRYGVTNIPAFVLVVNGKAVDRVVGVTTESRLRSMIARIPRKPAPAAVASNDSGRRTSAPRRTPTPRRSPSGTFGGSPSGGSVDLGLPASFPGATVRANIDQEEDFAAPDFDGSAPAVERSVELESPRRSPVRPHEATVRIRVTDAEGVNFGSGTIIESKRGRALVLSCGHVFRDLKQGSSIEVDVFDWAGNKITRRETYVGNVLGYDLDSDVGLLAIPAQKRLPVCPVAGTDHLPSAGDKVVNVGCSRGELPTIERIVVKQLNRYLGPDNLQCTGVPVQGRSGGGLFDANGRIVGVCIARDPRDQEGIYAGPKAIHALLDQQELAYLHRSKAPERPARPTVPNDEVRLAANERSSAPADDQFVFADSTRVAPRPSRTTGERTLEDVGETEVICIIRKHGEPESASRVVVIKRASGEFVDYLAGEVKTQPSLTSRHVERPTTRPRPNDEMDRRLEQSGWELLRKPAKCSTSSRTRRR